ncbi:tissue factor pathway inhibitor isoform X2 [Tenrec ecaudatus]|uniref:tissue factor pathway inhibitor isoform X2 n=1 Tax=Tenrec ecaudatus TaxID=94439 RepID=UPI003F5A5550
MGRTLKTAPVLWASVILLLCHFPALLSAGSEEEEEDDEFTNITDVELPPLKLLNSFCALKAEDGPCKALIKRFFFNIHTRQCEPFIYGGCYGNNNSFENVQECREKCIPGKPDFCFLEEDAGICRAFITRYFYNKESKKCERFTYGGCLGNMNNFESLEECKSSCEDTGNDVKVPLDPVTNNTLIPQPTKVPRVSGNDVKAPLDPVTNNILIPKTTKVPRVSRVRSPSWCLTPADRGLCRANENRFYYNSNIGKCLPFKYSGCGGNENNFTTKRACLKSCKRGFIQGNSKGGLIKTKRKGKQKSVKIVYEQIFVKNT